MLHYLNFVWFKSHKCAAFLSKMLYLIASLDSSYVKMGSHLGIQVSAYNVCILCRWLLYSWKLFLCLVSKKMKVKAF